MKKSLICVFVLLIALACDSCNQNKSKSALLAPIETSLNGINKTDARTMVDAFLKNKQKYVRKTSVWFSRRYIDSLDALLNTEKDVDGVRIYLARKNQVNTFILVTTKDSGAYVEYPGMRMHRDYFHHTEPFLRSTLANHLDEDGNDKGALLYGKFDCPKETCIRADHYISCDSAKSWVINFNSDSTINTYSEWFESAVIHHLKLQLDNAPPEKQADGIRIYLGFKRVEKRHVFIIVTTEKAPNPGTGEVHRDYYECYPTKGLTDNGEQCPNNCKGVTLP